MSWLERNLIVGPYLKLIINEDKFKKCLKKMKVINRKFIKFINENADATTHYFRDENGELVILVCIKINPISLLSTYALLVHEAVHVWQKFKEEIGEDIPSKEFEAYSIQRISQNLFYEYERQCANNAKTDEKH